MPIIYNKVQNLQERVEAALADDFKHNAIETAQNTFHAKRELLVEQLPMWEDYRDACEAIRDHVTANLDYYVREFATNAEAAGYKLHFAPTATDALHAVLDIVEETGALSCVKSKSMMTEEIGVNDLFEDIGVKVVETDCAEAIIQTAEDKPSHIVVPALHFDRKAIADRKAQVEAEIRQIPQNMAEIKDEEQQEQMEQLLDMLEDNDDVQNVWHNWEEAE